MPFAQYVLAARQRITFPTAAQASHLCPTCYEEAAFPDTLLDLEGALPDTLRLDQEIRDAIVNGRCKYCRESVTAGCGGLASIRGQHFTLWCERCRKDLAEFDARPENQFTVGLPFEDKAALLRSVQEMAERDLRELNFMKQRILQRRKES